MSAAGIREAAGLAILAGGGDLPLEVAERARAAGRSVHIIGIRGEADVRIERFPHTWTNWGGLGHLLQTLSREHCRELVILGKVSRPDLSRLRPDLGFFLNLPALLSLLIGGDDALLTRVVRFFEAKGITIRGAHEVAPDLVAPAGTLSRIEPAPLQLDELARGFALVRALGPFDVGQAAVLGPAGVIAIEAAEGTDRMLERVAELPGRVAGDAAARAGVMVKCPKPGQELRVDMPVIGAQTIERAAAAGLAGLGVESGTVILAKRGELCAAADAHQMFLVGAPPPEPPTTRRLAGRGVSKLPAYSHLTHRKPAARALADIAHAAHLIEAARPFGCGRAVIVRRGYVIAVEASEGLALLLKRCRALRPWGRLISGRSSGVLVADLAAFAADEGWDAGLARRIADAGLAGMAATGGASELGEMARSFEETGLFLVSVAQDHD